MSDVFYEETVHASPEAFAQLLTASSDWLNEAASRSSHGAETVDAHLRARFGEGRMHLTVSKRARVEIGEVTRKKGSVTVPLVWEAAGYSGLFPVMDAVMQVVRVGPTTSRIVFWGRYDPPLGPAGRFVDRYIAHEIANSTVRAFMRAVIRKLDEADLLAG